LRVSVFDNIFHCSRKTFITSLTDHFFLLTQQRLPTTSDSLGIAPIDPNKYYR
jgi:hypothetical protein